ncbi:Mg(2+) transport ATPase protein C [Lachnospiraceae bacterium KM106-2]|nr:Mg(2+) transport ATPase protein C [Lachnospiraceae bacterium KM106-2]
MKEFLTNDQVLFLGISLPRLLLTAILCGIIGFEREQHVNRPAGARTHMLVGVASCLIMIISEFVYQKYDGAANIDPTRLGAQVISGIGFLGAGTIIKEGYNVKGLTTAASLWAVSCVGLAVGCGFYSGAIVATLIIYITLICLKSFMERHSHYRTLCVHCIETEETMEQVRKLLDSVEISIQEVEYVFTEEEVGALFRIHMILSTEKDKLEYILSKISEMNEVIDVYVER